MTPSKLLPWNQRSQQNEIAAALITQPAFAFGISNNADGIVVHFTGRNFTHIGEGASTFCPVGVSRPVFLSIRKTTMSLLS